MTFTGLVKGPKLVETMVLRSQILDLLKAHMYIYIYIYIYYIYIYIGCIFLGYFFHFLKKSVFCFSVRGTFPCYLPHFGAKTCTLLNFGTKICHLHCSSIVEAQPCWV